MRHTIFNLTLIALFVVILNPVSSQDVRIDFSETTAEANGIIVTGPDFGRLPKAEILFSSIPTEGTFEDATDGHGVVIVAEPGEGILIQARPVSTPHSAIIRCNVRTDTANALIAIAALDTGSDQFVATNGPADGSSFVDSYQRLSVLFSPPTTGFVPIVQIVNTSETETLTAFVDRLDVFVLKPSRYYASEFLDGDEVDPESIDISPTTGYVNPDTGLHEIEVSLPGLSEEAKPLTMVLIPAGSFTMGCPEDERGYVGREWPSHQITITRPFYVGKFEITQAQWEAVMGENPTVKLGVGENFAVHSVSWDDCQEFLARLNAINAGTFRLPTEAEWEYVCRTGTTTRFFFGDALECDDQCEFCEIFDRHMWWCGNHTTPGAKEVGRKEPNAWGLYDVHGNVWEFCSDWYEDPSERGFQVDPTGPDSGEYRVIRGGHYANNAEYCRAALRSGVETDTKSVYIGLRIVRELE